ncbi:hypothetical protein Golomagni_01717 [Golovinomyces magnicellulatus]|nr:hypothetical protein Golomagni_01717 [Golovinomyces magnicellulatus]
MLPIHTTAYMFTPPNHAAEIMLAYLQTPEAYINQTHGTSAYIQWLNYHKREDPFNLTKDYWQYEHDEDLTLFWKTGRIDAPEFSSLAMDLLRINANSVASERVFSIMNLLRSLRHLAEKKTKPLAEIEAFEEVFRGYEYEAEDLLLQQAREIDDVVALY